MKKAISVLFLIMLTAGCLSGCSLEAEMPDDERLEIVTTIFPEYDWMMNILGENPAGAEVTLLLDKGVDLHSYQPTAGDILKISSCDIFVYVGGESDAWVEDALKNVVNKDMTVINLMEVLGDSKKEEELTGGMQEENEGDDDEPEYDEHVWLSLKNAAVITESMEAAIETADPGNASIYRKNTEAYIERLNVLDNEYKNAVSGAACDTLVFGDRFPFRYLVDDYGISYYAAFSGCSAETEASFETVTFLAKKVDELSLAAVIIIDGSDGKIAETIIENTDGKDQKILTLDSMQSVTDEDIASGTTYISIMEGDLKMLKDALNSAT